VTAKKKPAAGGACGRVEVLLWDAHSNRIIAGPK